VVETARNLDARVDCQRRAGGITKWVMSRNKLTRSDMCILTSLTREV